MFEFECGMALVVVLVVVVVVIVKHHYQLDLSPSRSASFLLVPLSLFSSFSFNMVLNQEKLAKLQAASRTGTFSLFFPHSMIGIRVSALGSRDRHGPLP